MKKTSIKWLTSFAGVMLLLTGCMNQNEGAAPRNDTRSENDVEQIQHINNENNHGTETNGEDSNVYGLTEDNKRQDEGISSHLEYRLANSDINGIKVFVIDDTVILADEGEGNNLQQAKEIMHVSFGDKTQVLTTTNSEAPALIEKIKRNITEKSPAYNQLTTDIQQLIEMTAEKGS